MVRRVWTFLRNSWIAYKGVSLWLNPQAYMIEKVINPIFRYLFYSFLILYGYKEKANITVFILGNAILLSSISALKGIGIIYFSERHQGTLIYFIVSPRSRLRIIVQKIFFHIIDAFITVLIGLCIMFVGFKLYYSLVQFLHIFLVVIIGVISVSLFGSLIASLGLLTRDINMLLNGVEVSMLLLSGVNIPISKFPVFLKYLSHISPLSHLMEGLNYIIQDKIYMAIPCITSEVILLIIYLLLGKYILNFLENKAKSIGNIDFY